MEFGLKKKSLQFALALDYPTRILTPAQRDVSSTSVTLSQPCSACRLASRRTAGLVLRGQKVTKENQLVFSKFKPTGQRFAFRTLSVTIG